MILRHNHRFHSSLPKVPLIKCCFPDLPLSQMAYIYLHVCISVAFFTFSNISTPFQSQHRLQTPQKLRKTYLRFSYYSTGKPRFNEDAFLVAHLQSDSVLASWLERFQLRFQLRFRGSRALSGCAFIFLLSSRFLYFYICI